MSLLAGPAQPKRSVIICADDFGISAGVNRAIAELIGMGRVTATGCMTVMPSWSRDCGLLGPLGGVADIGLHLTLTDQRPLGAMPSIAPEGRFPSLGGLVAAALSGRLDRSEVGDELRRQIDAFAQRLGRLPDFIDGHHHVHQFPVIRSILLGELSHWRGGPTPYLRICHTPLATVLARRTAVGRALAIGFFGAPLRSAARRLGIPTITGFGGVYDFADGKPYSGRMKQFCLGLKDNGLVMCHPGIVEDDLRTIDRLTDPREVEYAYFASAEYIEELSDIGVTPSRYRRELNAA